jgi:sterol desaturase/sphingolipid hydroxylase (fatty acid hydroxylase superfamily)
MLASSPSIPALSVPRKAFAYGIFPLTLALCGLVCGYAVAERIDYGRAFGALMLGLLAFYVALELAFPYRAEWTMTLDAFLQRDAKFLIANTLAQEAGRIAIGWASIHFSAKHAAAFSAWQSALKLIALFLLFEFLQYWYHRLSHELKGRAGLFLWRVHAAHHLPDRLYVMIHAIGHPIELLVTNVLLMLGLPILFGSSPKETFLFVLFANAIGIVSHLNADLRLGWLNYVFAGPETHRFHHSTVAGEAKNYGAVLMVFDLLFGTFVYKPGSHPSEVGVTDPQTYPDSKEVGAVLALPFRSVSAPVRDSTSG